MLTYEKAKTLFKNAKKRNMEEYGRFNPAEGVHLTTALTLIRFQDKYAVVKDYSVLFYITKKNEYIMGDLEANGHIRNIINKYTPVKMHLTKKRLMIGKMPSYNGLKIGAKGDVIIPEAWSPFVGKLFTCGDCDENFTQHLCASCYENAMDDSW